MDIKSSHSSNHQHEDENSDAEQRSVLEALLTSHSYTYDDANSTNDALETSENYYNDDLSSNRDGLETSSYSDEDPARDPLEIQPPPSSTSPKETKKKAKKYYDDLYSNKMFNPFEIQQARIQQPPKRLNATELLKKKSLDLKSRILQKRKSLLARHDEKESNGINIMCASSITEEEFAKKPRIFNSQSISKKTFSNLPFMKPKTAYVVKSARDDDIPIVPYSPSASIRKFDSGITVKHVKSTNNIQKIYRVIPKPKSASRPPQPSTSKPTSSHHQPPKPLFEVKLKSRDASDDEDLDTRIANFDKNGCRLKNPERFQEKFICEICKQKFLYKVSLLVHQKNNQCSYHMK